MKKLADFQNRNQSKPRPKVPVVPMKFKDDDATRRLVIHATKRVIKEHKQEVEKLAYR